MKKDKTINLNYSKKKKSSHHSIGLSGQVKQLKVIILSWCIYFIEQTTEQKYFTPLVLAAVEHIAC